MQISFFDEPSEVVNQLRLKKPELHFDYDEIRFNAHQRAFTVAKITRLDLLSDIQKSLETALKNGENFKDWSKKIKPTLIKKGWWGDEVKVINPKTGEEKIIKVDEKRLKTIFNTNIKTAYAMANYESGIKSNKKYIRYVAVLDHKTRQSHADMHGVIKPINDKWWAKNYPPNGWNCRCSVMFLDDDDLEIYGFKLNNTTLPNIADKDWNYHVGKNTSDIMAIYNEKIENLKGKVDDKFIEFAKKDFLATLKERVENLSLFSAIKNWFNNTKFEKTPKKELNFDGRIKITTATPQIKSVFNTNIDDIYLSQYTIITHKKHTNITPFDYFLAKKILKNNFIKYKKSSGNSFVFYYPYQNKFYRVCLKTTNNNEIYIDSIVKGTDRIIEEIKTIRKSHL